MPRRLPHRKPKDPSGVHTETQMPVPVQSSATQDRQELVAKSCLMCSRSILADRDHNLCEECLKKETIQKCISCGKAADQPYTPFCKECHKRNEENIAEIKKDIDFQIQQENDLTILCNHCLYCACRISHRGLVPQKCLVDESRKLDRKECEEHEEYRR